MSEHLENIRNHVGRENLFCGNLFEEDECSVDLTGVSAGDRVIIDLDKVFPGGQTRKKQCECVLLYFDNAENFIMVPIELKGGKNIEVSKAVKQLKGGADFAANYAPTYSKTRCFPVLFHPKPLTTAEYRQLKNSQSKVSFNGKPFLIKTALCGSKLVNVLPKLRP